MANWKNVGQVTITHLPGPTEKFESLEAALAFLVKAYGRIGARGGDYYCEAPWSGMTYFRIRDELGLIVPFWKIEDVCKRLPATRYPRYRLRHHKFRRGPVPYTGKRRGGWGGRSGRYVSYVRGREAFLYDMEEADGFLHPSSRMVENPNLRFDYDFWDGFSRSDSRIKNWKKHRRTQYKS